MAKANSGNFSITLLGLSANNKSLPSDLSTGLALGEENFSIIKSEPELIKTKIGINHETLVSDIQNNSHIIKLVYIPNAIANKTLETQRFLKLQFGLWIVFEDEPKYKGFASECRIKRKPEIKKTKAGLVNFTWEILATDYKESFLF